MIITNSVFSATALGELITVAPFISTPLVFSIVLLYIEISYPKFSKFSATASPNIPIPIIPIFIEFSPCYFST